MTEKLKIATLLTRYFELTEENKELKENLTKRNKELDDAINYSNRLTKDYWEIKQQLLDLGFKHNKLEKKHRKASKVVAKLKEANKRFRDENANWFLGEKPVLVSENQIMKDTLKDYENLKRENEELKAKYERTKYNCRVLSDACKEYEEKYE